MEKRKRRPHQDEEEEGRPQQDEEKKGRPRKGGEKKGGGAAPGGQGLERGQASRDVGQRRQLLLEAGQIRYIVGKRPQLGAQALGYRGSWPTCLLLLRSPTGPPGTPDRERAQQGGSTPCLNRSALLRKPCVPRRTQTVGKPHQPSLRSLAVNLGRPADTEQTCTDLCLSECLTCISLTTHN